MRTRLALLLTALMTVVLVALGVPLAAAVAGAMARELHADRLADLTLFGSLVPPAPDPDRSDAARAGEVESAALQRDLQRYDRLYGSAVTVVDTTGRPWLTSRADAPGGAAVQAAVETALNGRLADGPPRLLPWDRDPLVVAQPVVRDGDVVGAVVSVSPTRAARADVLNRWLLIAAAEIVALAGAAVLAGRLAGWLIRPVARLDEAAHQIGAGDLSARVPTGSGPPELRRLEHTFNEMAVHVQEAVEAQRAFVADASHQLRNPMAALLIRLEGLQILPAERMPEAARVALDDGRDLAGTLDRMLELARIEHVGAGAQALDVAALVDDRLTAWQVVAEHRAVRIVRTGLREAPGVHDRPALAGAVDAVVDNAIKYSPEGGTVTIDVAATAARVGVTVTDDGPGVAADELDHVAERFWRSPGADGGGTGLGMSIAKALLERYDGELAVAGTAERGLQVTLFVPGEVSGKAPGAGPGGELTSAAGSSPRPRDAAPVTP